ncbi:MAG: MOSC domain-containing protein [Chloroflexi bacterium]|nr:MOSC domain-containing protein [Anaerolineaceae bacterium]NLI44467.1 MOSC domain-containing protein [Chloroflexota bacterium]HOE35540.1 molybdopterin-binding protein [Anaerolineaceae bacterium]HOT26426.1 molybdopterin-binding protein [Anaerolineaceae bacterium]HQK04279.1 molybdopterin-binding protein [Anaerolineaceae bacterium]
MAKVVAVNISTKTGVVKHPVESALLKENFGIEGDAHAGDWHRQVSLLDQESVDKMTALGVKGLAPGIFAENITTKGIALHALPIGTRLRVGVTELEVTQIGKECHTHCQIYQQVGMCIMPTEGIFTRVIRGGEVRAGDTIEILNAVRAAVITISDKGAAGLREDKSGPALVQALQGRAVVMEQLIIPDEFEQIKAELQRLADSGSVDVILTTGGTGMAPRDVTPEATLAVVERLVPGIPEAMRAESRKITDRAMLSRAQAGIRGRTLIINFPGSPKAAVECLQVVLPVLDHAVETLRGEAYECAQT